MERILYVMKYCLLLVVFVSMCLSGCTDNVVRPDPPEFILSSHEIHFVTSAGVNPGQDSIIVTSAGVGSLEYVATDHSPRIMIYNQFAKIPSRFIVEYSVAGLTEGEYLDTIKVTAVGASNSPQYVEVYAHIAPVLIVSENPVTFFDYARSDPPDQQLIHVDLGSDRAFDYSVVSSVPWLSVVNSSGTGPVDLVLEVDHAGLGAGYYTGELSISSSEAGNSPLVVTCELTLVSWLIQEPVNAQQLQAVTFVGDQKGWASGALGGNIYGGYIINTVNGGTDWVLQGAEFDSPLTGIDFVDEQHGWVVGFDQTILLTNDGGATWIKVSSGLAEADSMDFHEVEFITVDSGWAVSDKGTILATVDGGSTWTVQRRDERKQMLTDIFFVDSRRGWAVGNYGSILVTTDGGANWSTQDSPAPYEVSDLRGVSFSDPLNGVAVGVSGLVLKTTDGGANWFSPYRYQPSPESFVWLHSVVKLSSGKCWAVGGEIDISSGQELNSIILYSEDGGSSWQAQPTGTTEWLFDVFFQGAGRGWAVGRKGLVLHTITGGF